MEDCNLHEVRPVSLYNQVGSKEREAGLIFQLNKIRQSLQVKCGAKNMGWVDKLWLVPEAALPQCTLIQTVADRFQMDPSSKEFTPPARNVFNIFTQKLMEATTDQTLTIYLEYIHGAGKMTHYIVGSQTRVYLDPLNEITLINCCHINTFLACLHLSLSHDNMIIEFIAEAEYTYGLHLGKIFEAFERGEFDRARFEWLHVTNNSCLSNSGPILDLAGQNWEQSAGALARFLCPKLCDYSTPFIKLESNMLPKNDNPIILQEVVNIYFQTRNHTSTCTERTGSCSINVTNGAPLILFISLEEFAPKINIADIPLDLFVFHHRYKFLSVSLGVLPPKGIGHITGLMHLCPDFIHYDGEKENPLERVTSAAQLKYTGIYLAIYIRDGLSSNQWSNNSPTLLEKIQEYKINTSLNLHIQ